MDGEAGLDILRPTFLIQNEGNIQIFNFYFTLPSRLLHI